MTTWTVGTIEYAHAVISLIYLGTYTIPLTLLCSVMAPQWKHIVMTLISIFENALLRTCDPFL